MTPEQIKERLEELVKHWDESMRRDKDKLAMVDAGGSKINVAFIEGCFFQTHVCRQALLNIIKDI